MTEIIKVVPQSEIRSSTIYYVCQYKPFAVAENFRSAYYLSMDIEKLKLNSNNKVVE